MLSQWNVQLQSGTNHRLYMGNDKRSGRHTVIRYCASRVSAGIKVTVESPDRTPSPIFLLCYWVSPSYPRQSIPWLYFVIRIRFQYYPSQLLTAAVQPMPFDFFSKFHLIILSGLNALYPDFVYLLAPFFSDKVSNSIAIHEAVHCTENHHRKSPGHFDGNKACWIGSLLTPGKIKSIDSPWAILWHIWWTIFLVSMVIRY